MIGFERGSQRLRVGISGKGSGARQEWGEARRKVGSQGWSAGVNRHVSLIQRGSIRLWDWCQVLLGCWVLLLLSGVC